MGQLLRGIHDKFPQEGEPWFEGDTNRTVRSRECFLPYINLIDATSSELGGACGFTSICSLVHQA